MVEPIAYGDVKRVRTSSYWCVAYAAKNATSVLRACYKAKKVSCGVSAKPTPGATAGPSHVQQQHKTWLYRARPENESEFAYIVQWYAGKITATKTNTADITKVDSNNTVESKVSKHGKSSHIVVVEALRVTHTKLFRSGRESAIPDTVLDRQLQTGKSQTLGVIVLILNGVHSRVSPGFEEQPSVSHQPDLPHPQRCGGHARVPAPLLSS